MAQLAVLDASAFGMLAVAGYLQDISCPGSKRAGPEANPGALGSLFKAMITCMYLYAWTSKMAKIMDPKLPILYFLEYWGALFWAFLEVQVTIRDYNIIKRIPRSSSVQLKLCAP